MENGTEANGGGAGRSSRDSSGSAKEGVTPSHEQEDILAALVDTVAQDAVSSTSAERTPSSSEPAAQRDGPSNATEAPPPVQPARRQSSGKKWPVVQPPQRYVQGAIASSFKAPKRPSAEGAERRRSADEAPKDTEREAAVLTQAASHRVSNGQSESVKEQPATNEAASLGNEQLTGPALNPSITLVTKNGSMTDPSPIAQQPPLRPPFPSVSQSPTPSWQAPPAAIHPELPPQPAAASPIDQAFLNAYTLQSMLNSMQPNRSVQHAAPPQGFQTPPQGYHTPPQGYHTPPQGFQVLQPQVYTAWPPQGYLVSPSGINVPQPVMQLVMPQMQAAEQQQFGAGPPYQDFRSLLNPAAAMVSPPLPSPVLTPVTAPPPPPFLTRQESRNLGERTR